MQRSSPSIEDTCCHICVTCVCVCVCVCVCLAYFSVDCRPAGSGNGSSREICEYVFVERDGGGYQSCVTMETGKYHIQVFFSHLFSLSTPRLQTHTHTHTLPLSIFSRGLRHSTLVFDVSRLRSSFFFFASHSPSFLLLFSLTHLLSPPPPPSPSLFPLLLFPSFLLFAQGIPHLFKQKKKK